MPNNDKSTELIERIKALPDEFESHSLDSLGVWLNKNCGCEDVSGTLTYEVMLEAGFVEEPLEKAEQTAGQRESWQLRRLRDALKDNRKALEVLDWAPKAIAWNECEVLIYSNDTYEVYTWGEYGCFVADAFRELLDPSHYEPSEFIEMLSDANVRAALI